MSTTHAPPPDTTIFDARTWRLPVYARLYAKLPRPRWPGRRATRRAAVGAALLLLALALALIWGWRATPSTAGLLPWVRAQDAMRHAPYTPLSAISPAMLRAIVASEDERFYTHHGIDTIGLLRAAWDDLRSGQLTEGGSTLTAQLAKNAYLHGYDHTLSLKAEDLMLAVKVEQRYSKDQILEMYLNLVYYGEGAYGIGAASQRYFGTAPANLTLPQAALLAGLVQAPGYYDPWCHPTQARARQDDVLQRMLVEGYITSAQLQAARSTIFAFWQAGATLPADAYCAP